MRKRTDCEGSARFHWMDRVLYGRTSCGSVRDLCDPAIRHCHAYHRTLSSLWTVRRDTCRIASAQIYELLRRSFLDDVDAQTLSSQRLRVSSISHPCSGKPEDSSKADPKEQSIKRYHVRRKSCGMGEGPRGFVLHDVVYMPEESQGQNDGTRQGP